MVDYAWLEEQLMQASDDVTFMEVKGQQRSNTVNDNTYMIFGE